jgi:hypothetical protein
MHVPLRTRDGLILVVAALVAAGLSIDSFSGTPTDTDQDGIPDDMDNCLTLPNGPLRATFSCDSQLDGDCDGYGNPCDSDFNNDGGVGLDDVSALLQAAGIVSADPNYDVNCDGAAGLDDVAYVLADAATPDIPFSGLACAGTIPCCSP